MHAGQKGYYSATFRSLFGDVPVRVRRLLACPCQDSRGATSFAVFDLDAATVAPELAYVTARYAALAPFGQVAVLLSELLPISGVPNAGTVRNRVVAMRETGVDPWWENLADKLRAIERDLSQLKQRVDRKSEEFAGMLEQIIEGAGERS